jgi:hypothetical protein
VVVVVVVGPAQMAPLVSAHNQPGGLSAGVVAPAPPAYAGELVIRPTGAAARPSVDLSRDNLFALNFLVIRSRHTHAAAQSSEPTTSRRHHHHHQRHLY